MLGWWSDNAPPVKGSKGSKNRSKGTREDEDTRAEFADYLTDKYLCSKLDPLQSSELVSKVRKTLSKLIEDFAAEGIIPKGIDEIKFVDASSHSAESSANAQYRKAPGSSLVSNMKVRREDADYDSGASGAVDDYSSKKEEANGASRRAKLETEKKTMKEQYAQYMKRNKTGKNVISDTEIKEDEEQDFTGAAPSSGLPRNQRGSVSTASADRESSSNRKNAEVSSKEAEDRSKAQEYEMLNSDIRSLLSSIQNPKLPTLSGALSIQSSKPEAGK